MITDKVRIAIAASALVTLGACADNSMFERPGDAAFGEANRQTMMAQVVNPDPEYDTELVTSGDHAAEAIERYRTDSVKQPAKVSTTQGAASGPN